MRVIARKKSEQNQALVDPWSLVHLASGLAAGLVNFPLGLGLGVATAYEVAEQAVERTGVGQGLFESSGPESVGNLALDLVLFTAGYWLGRKWNGR